MTRRILPACSAAALLLPALLVGQTARSPQSGALDPTVVRQVVDSVASLVALRYVVPDTGKLIAAHLRQRIASGAYSRPLNRAQLVDYLSEDMKKVNGDLHLYLRAVDVGDTPGASGMPSPGSGGGSAAGPVMVRRGSMGAEAMAAARHDNFNIDRADRLEGNIGYLSLSLVSSMGGEEALRVLDAAMAFLERTDAMIIDIRQTRGGDAGMSDYVASYFLPDSTPTLTSYVRSNDQTRARRAHAVPGTKRTDVPLFLLIGPGSASGAEDLAFALKQSGRATLVGERTAGAGRINRTFPVGNGFVVSISGGRTFDPRTDAEWEQIGVQPHLRVPAQDALIAAHSEALSRLAESAPDSSRKRSLAWTREILLANAKPARVSASMLSGYAGTYDLREISATGGKLYHRARTGRPMQELVPLGPDTFGLGTSNKVMFERTAGRVTALKLLTPDGQVNVFSRVGR